MKLRTRGAFNLKRWVRVASDRVHGTAFDRVLAAAASDGRRDFVFAWNRGLGDVALGLAPLFARIRARVAASRISVFTRADLADMFRMAGADVVHVVPDLTRDAPLDITTAAARLGVALPTAAVVFGSPDPTRWLDGRRREFAPTLAWNTAWNRLAEPLLPTDSGSIVIGAHVHSETAQHYGYIKDWPAASWQHLFARFPAASGVRWVLFGHGAKAMPAFAGANITDLRGRTGWLDLVAVIRTRCRILVAPDSGILAAAFYLADAFPLELISLWSDPRQGILKQACPSPNPALRHTVLLGRDDDVRTLTVDEVAAAVSAALARANARSDDA